jgi:hypothetical protein
VRLCSFNFSLFVNALLQVLHAVVMRHLGAHVKLAATVVRAFELKTLHLLLKNLRPVWYYKIALEIFSDALFNHKSVKFVEAKMGAMQMLVILGAIVTGAAVAISLFAFYPDLMLQNTSLDPSGSGSQFSESVGDTAMTSGGSPQAITP